MANTHTLRKFRYLIGLVTPGLLVLASYQRAWLRFDIAAGLSVAAIALPVGIAYADLAGVPPVVGMYAAIFPLFAYALFGSSKQLMTGPDAATCIIVAAALGPLAGGDPARYAALLLMLTLMTGVLYLLAGAARLGFIANFLSQPILTGYLNGIALLIIVGQLPKLFGYHANEEGFFEQILEFTLDIDNSHWPTAALGLGLLALLVLVMRFTPRLPGALVVVVASIALVSSLGLDQQGVAVLGEIPGGLPSLVLPGFERGLFGELLSDASGILLVSFTSGVLTAKSFASRNGYKVDANQELIGFGACNLASGLAQGFPVTGADSRTAINNAMGGKTQLVGIVAGGTMLLVLLFLTGPLAYVPATALAAVILVSAVGLFDLSELRKLFKISYREFALSVATTLGVLAFGVLPGVLVAVALSLVWILSVSSRPNDAVLGNVKGLKGFHDIADYPEARTIPGLLLYRFDANLVFYNVEYFVTRLRAAIAAQKTPVEWVVIDASSINVVDVSALNALLTLRRELEAEGIAVYQTRVKRHLERYFNADFASARRKADRRHRFQSIKSAIRAFEKHKREQRQAATDHPNGDNRAAESRPSTPADTH